MGLHQVDESEEGLSVLLIPMGAQIAYHVVQGALRVTLEVDAVLPQGNDQRMHGDPQQQVVVGELVLERGGYPSHQFRHPVGHPTEELRPGAGDVGVIGNRTPVVVELVEPSVELVIYDAEQRIVAESDALISRLAQQLG